MTMRIHMRIEVSMPTPAPEAKRRLNVSVRGDLIERAREAGLNLSELVEQSLLRRLREEEARRWKEDNREAIAAYNARIERDGPLNADLLRF